MASFNLDALQYMRNLTDVGVPHAQAEVMAAAFMSQSESFVSKDYLDARLGEQEAKIEAKFNARFATVESKLNLHSWILAIIAASTVIPAISGLIGY